MTARKWYQRTVCGFDLETTGVDAETDHIVQIGIHVSVGSPLGAGFDVPIPAMSYEHLVNPGVPITNSEIHGITDEMVQGARTEAEEVAELVWFLRAIDASGIPVVAYNAAFDLSLSRAAARRHNIPWDLGGLVVIDPLVIDRQLDKWRKGSRKQADVARFYGIETDTGRLHSAAYDAEIAVQIARVMGSKHGTQDWATEEFTATQARWAVEQQESLQAYFTKSGKTDDNGDPAVVSRGFPYRHSKE